MDPILNLIAASARMPPETQEGATRITPFFQVGPQGFLLRTASGGRMHYAPGQGIALADPADRPPGDLRPFVLTSGFAAAAWFDGRVPLSANAAQLPDGRILLLAAGREDLREAMALALAESAGLLVSDSPVAIDPEDPTRVCTNGQPITLHRQSSEAPEPPVRPGARRLATDLPAIDGARVHSCVGLVSLVEGSGATAEIEQISLLHCIGEIKKHVFMPLVGTAIWGEETIGAAHMVLASNLPMVRFTLPADEMPSARLAAELLAQLDAAGE